MTVAAEDTTEGRPPTTTAGGAAHLAPSSPDAANRLSEGPDLSSSVDTQPSDNQQLGAFRHVGSVALIVLAALALSMALQLLLVSSLEHRTAQQGAFDTFRKQLAQGTAPLGQANGSGKHLLRLGTPVALIDIPAIHVHQVVLEGTTSAALMAGPGHRRDTPLPGQPGTSVIYGRVAAYGGPFRRLHKLKVGTTFTVRTQEGVSTYKVIGRRHAGDPSPPPLASGGGRVLLITATGTPFIPDRVLRVDADLITPAFGSSRRLIPVNAVPPAQRPLGTDVGSLWALVLWLEALLVVAIGIVWSWSRWGRTQTWIVFLPLTAVVAFFASDQFMRLLPNLM